MTDPLEPLREMIEKWEKVDTGRTGLGTEHSLTPAEKSITKYCAKELAAVLPALEEAMAIGPCDKHPKMFWIEGKFISGSLNGELIEASKPGHCTLCAERDAARGEALSIPEHFWRDHYSYLLASVQELRTRFSDLAIELEKHSNGHIHDDDPATKMGAAVEGVCGDRINAILALDPSAVKAAEEHKR